MPPVPNKPSRSPANIQFGKISPQLKYTTPPTSTYLFLITLAGLEGLILTYWVGLRLYQVSSSNSNSMPLHPSTLSP